MAIDLQKIKNETEVFMRQLSFDKSRIYQITAAGDITERTADLRNYFQRILQSIEQLGKT